jgi:hypothetical protein
MPSAAIPLLTFEGFEITLKRSVYHWFTFLRSKHPKYQEETLAFICDRIAEYFWFAQISYRVKNDKEARRYHQRVPGRSFAVVQDGGNLILPPSILQQLSRKRCFLLCLQPQQASEACFRFFHKSIH